MMNKVHKIYQLMEKTFCNKNMKHLWGKNRPYLNKGLFTQKIRESKYCSQENEQSIVDKIKIINKVISGQKWNEKYGRQMSSKGRQRIDNLQFYLCCDKEMKWIDLIEYDISTLISMLK